MTAAEIIERLIAKGHRRDEICRGLDISPKSLYTLRYLKAAPSRELDTRLRALAACFRRFGIIRIANPGLGDNNRRL